MRPLLPRLAVLALLLGIFTGFAPTAMAAAPSNDMFAGAKLVTLGFNETLDTTEATSEGIDGQLLQTCDAPAADASVYYALDGDGSEVLIDTSASNYSTALIVVTGSPGNFTPVNCGASFVSFDSEAGVRYYIMVFDLQEDGGGNGGSLSIAFSESVQPKLTFSVDSRGTLDTSSGSATISGSYTCTAGADFSISVDAKDGKVVGHGDFQNKCDGTLQLWTVVIKPERGTFKGKLKTTSFGSASTPDQGFGYEIQQKVDLKSRRS